MTTHQNITFELYLNVQTVISGPYWSVCSTVRSVVLCWRYLLL